MKSHNTIFLDLDSFALDHFLRFIDQLTVEIGQFKKNCCLVFHNTDVQSFVYSVDRHFFCSYE